MTKLSIIIPTFNSGSTIDCCLGSIASQTFTDYEILIQDGGSSDNTIELVKNFQEANPDVNIKLRQEKDGGIYDAMNRATLLASGEWLYYLGSDDGLHSPHVLGNVMGSKAAQSSNVIYGSVRPVGVNGQWVNPHTYQGRFSLIRLLSVPMCHQAIFYRTSFARKIGPYNARYVVWADSDFNLRCLSKTRFKFVDLVVANYFTGGFSGNGRRDEIFDADLAENAFRYFGKFNPQVWIGLSRKRCAETAKAAYKLREDGDPECLAVLLTSLLQWPFAYRSRYKALARMVFQRLQVTSSRPHNE